MTMRKIIDLLIGLVAAFVVALAPAKVALAASAVLSVSPSAGTYQQGATFTVAISEDSGSNPVDSVRLDLTYDASKLQVVGFSTAANPFTTCVSAAYASGGAISTGDCTLLGGTKQGKQTLASVTFKVLAGDGLAEISFKPSSKLVYAGTDLSWTQVDGAYSLTVPAAPAPANPAPASTPSPAPEPEQASNNNTQRNTASSPSQPRRPGAVLEVQNPGGFSEDESIQTADESSSESVVATQTSNKKSYAGTLVGLGLLVLLVAAVIIVRKLADSKEARGGVVKKASAARPAAKKSKATKKKPARKPAK